MEHRIATSQLLIRKFISVAIWTVYSKVWQEWRGLVSEVGGALVRRMGYICYFILSAGILNAGVSVSSMSRKLAGLAFILKLAGQHDALTFLWYGKQCRATAQVAMLVLSAGLSVDNYSSHAIQVGAATEVIRWGLGDQVVQSIGRQESVRFQSYVLPYLLYVRGFPAVLLSFLSS